MTDDKHILQLRRIVDDVLQRQGESLSADQRISSVPGWDSVAMVQILLALEAETGIEFDTTDIVNIKTVGDILDMLKKYS